MSLTPQHAAPDPTGGRLPHPEGFAAEDLAALRAAIYRDEFLGEIADMSGMLQAALDFFISKNLPLKTTVDFNYYRIEAGPHWWIDFSLRRRGKNRRKKSHKHLVVRSNLGW